MHRQVAHELVMKRAGSPMAVRNCSMARMLGSLVIGTVTTDCILSLKGIKIAGHYHLRMCACFTKWSDLRLGIDSEEVLQRISDLKGNCFYQIHGFQGRRINCTKPSEIFIPEIIESRFMSIITRTWNAEREVR
jgi:hypothetical protein